MKNEPLKSKSFELALKIIDLCNNLCNRNDYVLSKQILRSGTAIGALIIEAKNAESSKDFVHKLSIAQKECGETLYWLELLLKSETIDAETYHGIVEYAEQISKMLSSSIITVKKQLKS